MSRPKSIHIHIDNSAAHIYSVTSKHKKLLSQKDFLTSNTNLDSLQEKIYKLISELRDKYPQISINIYSSSLRKQMDAKTWKDFVNEFYLTTGVFFHIVDKRSNS